jgi:predicted nucleic acid-binding protein
MKIVIDSNRVIAALLKDSTTRSLLFNKNFEFIAPSYVFSEINKYKDYIINQLGINNEDFEILIKFIFENIKIIPEAEYTKFTEELDNEMKDIKDIPYLALAIFTKAEGIWTHDPHFKQQDKVKIYTNIDLLKFIKEKD